MVRVAVLGAGINGVACAARVKEEYKDFEVTIISEEFSPNTTGDGSGGLWFPYLCADTPSRVLLKWSSATYHFIHKLFLCGGLNISMAPVYAMYRSGAATPEWRHAVFGFTALSERQLGYFSELWGTSFITGHTFITFVVPPPEIISYLYNQFVNSGGKVLRGKITSLEDSLLDSFDVVVNCTGLGARQIVPDSGVTPVRGQVLRVIAPWINQIVLDQDTGNYIIPNYKTCVMGGTRQKGDFNLNVDPKDTERIIEDCTAIIPSLKEAEVSTTWVGLRPGRNSVRLEPEFRDGKLYIHNYGHGGSGFTLFWGCAADVLDILDNHLPRGTEKAKL